ncbi:MAG: hypothetical protein JWR01_2676 [Subtercola sp.]|nr:hypothetical protein [Subtercola sp.]
MTGFAALVDRWRTTDRVALTTDTAQLGYRSWAVRGERLARAFTALGLQRPARVAVALPNGPDFAVVLYAAAKVGLTLVPISTWAAGGELRRVLDSSAPDLLITSGFSDAQRNSVLDLTAAGIGPGPDRVFSTTPDLDIAGLDELEALAESCTPAAFAAACAAGTGDADLVVLYTSGSTGLPKGVILQQGSVTRNGSAIAERMGLGGLDRVYSYFPMFFSGGLCNVLTGAVSVGAEVLTQARFSTAGAAQLIARRGATAHNVWHDGLSGVVAEPSFTPGMLARMQRGLVLDAPTFDRFGLPFDEGVNMYGSTETATAFTCHDHLDPVALRRSTHGLPLAGNRLRIVDPDTGAPRPDGTEGEISVAGPNLMRGYTDGSHVALTDEDGFFHTGDLGHIGGSGHLHYTGRLKTLLKVKGLTVQPEEVEAVLTAHPGIRTAVVVGIGDGDESLGVRALIVAERDAAGRPIAGLDSIEAYCRRELSSYKVPRAQFVEENEILLSASHKIDRQRARAIPVPAEWTSP